MYVCMYVCKVTVITMDLTADTENCSAFDDNGDCSLSGDSRNGNGGDDGGAGADGDSGGDDGDGGSGGGGGGGDGGGLPSHCILDSHTSH